jgi:hypothetical protein
LAREHIEAGRLVAKLTAEPRFSALMYYSWASTARGKALAWFVQRLEQEDVRRSLLP